MKKYLQLFDNFLREAKDPSYYQETFYFTVLISMNKDVGGSRDETKNDIRALPEILTVTLMEPEKGGIQRDLGTKYLSTLKLHVRKPRDVNQKLMMQRVVLLINNLRGVSVLRYKETKPKPRRKPFRGPGSYKIAESDVPLSMQERKKRKKKGAKSYQQSPARRRNLRKGWQKYTQTGPNNSGPYKKLTRSPSWKSAPPGAPGGLEEVQLDEAMKTAADLPEGVVVAVKDSRPHSYLVYYALRDNPEKPLKAHDLDRQEAGIDIYGLVSVFFGEEPREDVWMVKSSRARDGFGPLLYDVALEIAGDSGLKPDNLDVSEESSAVWKHYDMQRPDVDSEMLADGPEDYELFMPPELAVHPEKYEHLAKAYYKKDKATIQELIHQDQYVEIDDDAGPLYEGRPDQLLEDVLITIKGDDPGLMAFDVHTNLNQKLWHGDEKLRAGVKAALLDIVEEFLEGLDLDVEVKDIIITGSIANYNWSKYSDIDIHILVDFKEVNENEQMVQKFFDSVRSNWNRLHDIYVKGHEVEIYVQNEKEPHISTGVYSLQDDEWLVVPKKIKPQIDRASALTKMRTLAREIDKLGTRYNKKDYEGALEQASKIKDKIKSMRRAGLQRQGIYAPENLAFKMLRRSGHIEELFDVYTGAYDKVYSLDQ